MPTYIHTGKTFSVLSSHKKTNCALENHCVLTYNTTLQSVLATVFKHGLPNLQARISNLQARPCL